MMKNGKIWGQTELIHANGVLEFHRIETVKGGVCSKHKHAFKWNGFFVESGRLLIRVWKNDYDLVDETILGPGDFTQVKPGENHQFEALEDSVAFELYWAEFNHNDIQRENVGGVKDSQGTSQFFDEYHKACIGGLNPHHVDKEDPLKSVMKAAFQSAEIKLKGFQDAVDKISGENGKL